MSRLKEKQDFLQLAMQRQSQRNYADKPVEKEKIERCLEAARLAPSASNAQPWKFIVVDDVDLKNKIADTTANKLLPINHWTKQAPVHVVLVLEKPNLNSKIGEIVRNKKFIIMDVGIAAEHFCLQAVEEGLGTCMIGWFNEKKVKEMLNIPKSKRAMLVISVGYPEGKHREKIRKPMDEIVSYNRY
ncbi:MAG: nitroreductase family protein [Bacteroidota bacterium]|nr:nitroreductase family protein [Bacteroidota bacterium]